MSATKFKQLDRLRVLYGEPRSLREANGETGWRLSFLGDSGKIDYLESDGLMRAFRCRKQPLRGWAPQVFDSHQAPHADCVCGFRMLIKLQDLHKYWDHQWRIHRASGISWEDYYRSSEVVLVHAEALGKITGGVQDDPLNTIRAGLLKPLEAYLPPWVDSELFKFRNPTITPKPITELPGDPSFFAPMRQPKPPARVLAYQPLKHHVAVRTGVGDVMIPRSHLQPQRVIDAVWGAVEHRNANDCLDELVDRLVIPLTDLERPRIGDISESRNNSTWREALAQYAEGPSRGN